MAKVVVFDIPSFNESDLILVSRIEDDPTKFRVHRDILASASPFFETMFSLPQGSSQDKQPVLSLSEPSIVIRALIDFIYPIVDPAIETLDDLLPILAAAVKYDLTDVVRTLGAILVSPQFVQDDPIRVYAIAMRYELEEEARTASRYTFSVNLFDPPLSDDLKHITADAYLRLLILHRERANAAVAMMKYSQDVKCMQCNGSAFTKYAIPKWWIQFERRAKQELNVRPTTNVVFSQPFLEQAVIASGCKRCKDSVSDSWKFLENLKMRIDELPSTI